ncbi:DUF6600 domain-containing protein [Acidisoma sp.]|uniref:DUF6600 domain-containing protein n=1 Tax=Acidisoma sp. TaxID=1872115 RepID=UPI003B0054F7
MSLRVKWSLLPAVAAGVTLAANGAAFSVAAVAQTPPPPAPPGAAPGVATTADPPARVGWLSNLSGSVSFHSASQDQWVTATPNYPVATGDAVWTQPQAAASVMVDSTRLALSGGTELTAQEIDQSTIAAVLSQGEVFLDVAALQQGQSVVIATPRGTAQITGNGEYEIYAGDSGTPTYVTAVVGSIQFTGLGAAAPQAVGAQQTLIVQGTNPVQAQLGAMQQDQFLTAMLQQITPPPPPSAAQAPAACAQMTGAAVLSNYGTWQPQPSVGTVWFPQVASTWVPYREGRWVYVQPWGWTWVDNAPWGFAPFHYGRWSQFGGRWGWVPEPVASEGYGYGGADQPVYAPALVSFLGAAAGAFTAAAFASGAIGWAPLGVHEPYYPPYQVSPRYFGAYNRAYVPDYNTFYRNNVTVQDNRVSYRNVTINNYGGAGQPAGQAFNRQGATFVPRDAMLGSRPIAEVARALPANATAQPFRPNGAIGAEGLPRPTAGTWGVTPALAQREHLAAAPAGAAPRAFAQGPAIHAVPAAAAGRVAAPSLVPHAAVAPNFRGGVAGARLPAEAVRPGTPATGARPEAATARTLPPLAAPGAHGEAAHPQFTPAAPNAARIVQPGAAARTDVAPGQPRAAQPGAAGARVETPHPAAARPAEAPRVSAPAAAAPRAEAPRVPAPRVAVPAVAAPRVEAPRVQAPRVEAPRVEAPRVQAPRLEAPRVEAPRVQAPRLEAPRVEAPRVQAPRVEAPRGGAPQGEVRPPHK